MANSALSYDIVIAGGGLSGLLTAVALSHQTNFARIAIIESNDLSTASNVSFDDRVIALSHGSVDYIKQLGVWHQMSADATAIEHIHISDRGNYGKARIAANDHNVDALGHVVPLSSIANTLLQKAKTFSTIDWLSPNSIAKIEFLAERVELVLDNTQQINTKLLVACDGGQSMCRKAAGIANTSRDYQQSAVIANVTTQNPHNNVAYERFTEQGPIAMLPMTGNQCSLVWTVNHDNAEIIKTLNEQAFCQALEEAFGRYLGAIEGTTKRSVFPLKLVQAERQTFHRLALVGNASHAIHPIAGQGFNLGIRDIKELVQLLSEGNKDTQKEERSFDPGRGKVLNQYQQCRGQDQQEIITLTDSMVTLFSNELPPLVAGRNVGVKVMNYCRALQQAFVNKTMGY
ncbi:2-octaprenyl-6-methoxyphenyl hydroxylase [Thalassotalea euphylliae]|uniref:2-octaprenyl-6-methoxyphenyl hydroxylase n=1 Tax=Thalassotalea euphylliae TaxID=1655234 RepID=UPI003634E937